ncbi:MAG: ABC transporter permease [Candidatus Methanodesulfokora sp.]
MNLLDIVKFSARAIAVRKRRAALTLMGIFVGVVTLTAVVSYAEGFGVYINQLIKGSSLRTIYLMSMQSPLTASDISTLATIPHVERVAPMVRLFTSITINGITARVSITGLDMDYLQDATPDLKILEGVIPQNYEGGAIIGYNLASRFVDDPAALVGTTVKIMGSSIRINAVAAPYGTSIFTDVDNSIILPLYVAEKLQTNFFRASRGYAIVMIVADSESNVDYVVNELRSEFGDTATAISMKDLQRDLSTMINTSVLVIGAIASMTIVVASIGMMNSMYTAVTERTKIIGTMRALGASRTDIVLLFLVEAVIISVSGVLPGMAVGYLGALAFSLLTGGIAMGAGMGEAVRAHPGTRPQVGISMVPTLPPDIAFTIFLITVAVSIIGAIPPSLRAASLEPSEALRYE